MAANWSERVQADPVLERAQPRGELLLSRPAESNWMRPSTKLERAMRLAEGKLRQEHSVEGGGEPRKGTNVSLVPFSQKNLNSMIVVDLHPGVSYRGSLIDTICRL